MRAVSSSFSEIFNRKQTTPPHLPRSTFARAKREARERYPARITYFSDCSAGEQRPSERRTARESLVSTLSFSHSTLSHTVTRLPPSVHKISPFAAGCLSRRRSNTTATTVYTGRLISPRSEESRCCEPLDDTGKTDDVSSP